MTKTSPWHLNVAPISSTAIPNAKAPVDRSKQRKEEHKPTKDIREGKDKIDQKFRQKESEEMLKAEKQYPNRPQEKTLSEAKEQAKPKPSDAIKSPKKTPESDYKPGLGVPSANKRK